MSAADRLREMARAEYAKADALEVIRTLDAEVKRIKFVYAGNRLMDAAKEIERAGEGR